MKINRKFSLVFGIFLVVLSLIAFVMDKPKLCVGIATFTAIFLILTTVLPSKK